jgi:hypothetical protein
LGEWHGIEERGSRTGHARRPASGAHDSTRHAHPEVASSTSTTAPPPPPPPPPQHSHSTTALPLHQSANTPRPPTHLPSHTPSLPHTWAGEAPSRAAMSATGPAASTSGSPGARYAAGRPGDPSGQYPVTTMPRARQKATRPPWARNGCSSTCAAPTQHQHARSTGGGAAACLGVWGVRGERRACGWVGGGGGERALRARHRHPHPHQQPHAGQTPLPPGRPAPAQHVSDETPRRVRKVARGAGANGGTHGPHPHPAFRRPIRCAVSQPRDGIPPRAQEAAVELPADKHPTHLYVARLDASRAAQRVQLLGGHVGAPKGSHSARIHCRLHGRGRPNTRAHTRTQSPPPPVDIGDAGTDSHAQAGSARAATPDTPTRTTEPGTPTPTTDLPPPPTKPHDKVCSLPRRARVRQSVRTAPHPHAQAAPGRSYLHGPPHRQVGPRLVPASHLHRRGRGGVAGVHAVRPVGDEQVKVQRCGVAQAPKQRAQGRLHGGSHAFRLRTWEAGSHTAWQCGGGGVILWVRAVRVCAGVWVCVTVDAPRYCTLAATTEGRQGRSPTSPSTAACLRTCICVGASLPVTNSSARDATMPSDTARAMALPTMCSFL